MTFYKSPRWQIEITVADEATAVCKLDVRGKISSQEEADEVVTALTAIRPLLATAQAIAAQAIAAQAIAAHSAETGNTGSAEGKSAVAEGDVPKEIGR